LVYIEAYVPEACSSPGEEVLKFVVFHDQDRHTMQQRMTDLEMKLGGWACTRLKAGSQVSIRVKEGSFNSRLLACNTESVCKTWDNQMLVLDLRVKVECSNATKCILGFIAESGDCKEEFDCQLKIQPASEQPAVPLSPTSSPMDKEQLNCAFCSVMLDQVAQLLR